MVSKALSHNVWQGCAAFVTLCIFATFVGCGASQTSREDVDSPETVWSDEQENLVEELVASSDMRTLRMVHQELGEIWPLMMLLSSSKAVQLQLAYERVGVALVQESLDDAVGEEEDAHDRHGALDTSGLRQAILDLQLWERQKGPSALLSKATGCPVTDHPQENAACVVRTLDAQFQQLDASLSPPVKQLAGDVAKVGHRWLGQRVVRIGQSIVSADQVRFQPIRLWTGLSEEEQTVAVPLLSIVADKQGLRVGVDGGWIGFSALGNQEQREIADFCCLSSAEAELIAWRSTSESSKWGTRQLETLGNRLAVCAAMIGEDQRQTSVTVAIDAEWAWRDVLPLVKWIQNQSVTAYWVGSAGRTKAVSALQIPMMAPVSDGACGARVHVRDDGVVFRGMGTSTQLVSWSDTDALARVTAIGRETAKRCHNHTQIRVYIDDDDTDWGLITRVIERLSWPQVCDAPGCITLRIVDDGRTEDETHVQNP